MSNMASNKILILYAPCGAGHQKAAQTLHEYFQGQAGNDVEIKDILDFAPSWYRKIYRDGYYFLIRKFPKLWAYLYQGTDLIPPETSLTRLWRKLEHKWFKAFFRYLATTCPTTIITTHFLPISLLKDHNKGNCKLAVVVTDYCAHNIWVSVFVDRYFVAAEEVKKILVRKGIVPERITVTGIPFKPIGSFKDSRVETRVSLGLNKELFTVLLLSGAGGVGDIAAIVKGLEHYAYTLQLIVNTGLNRSLGKKLSRDFARTPLILKILGFTESIYQYYYVADMVISKPGGLTVTECLAFGLPMLMVNAIPGQEEENAKFVEGNQAGIMIRDLSKLPEIVMDLTQNRDRLESMKNNALRIAPQEPDRKIFTETVG